MAQAFIMKFLNTLSLDTDLMGFLVIIQIKNQNLSSNLNGKLNSLINSYSNTPQYLDKDIMQNYSFLVQDIKAEKNSILKVLEYRNSLYKEKKIQRPKNKNNEETQRKNRKNMENLQM